MNCKNCHHPLGEHCKGNQRHTHYKDEMRMVKDARVTVCTTKHCNNALCDCVDFVE